MTNLKKNSLGRLFLSFIAAFPFPVLRIFARFFSAIAWYGKTRIRNIVTVNINNCYPLLSEKEKACLIRQSLLHVFTTGFEMPRTWLHAKHNESALYGGITGLELIDSALSSGKGLILVTPHLGHWEFMLLVMAHRYPCTLLCNNIDDIVDIGIHGPITAGRTKTGARLVEATQGIKPLVRALKAGEIVIIAPDQIPSQSKGYIFSNFFGQETASMTLLSRLAKATGAELLSGFAKRHEDGRYKVVIRPVDPLLLSKQLEESVEGMNKTVERLINEAPEQYLWTYKRFRIDPKGKRKIY